MSVRRPQPDDLTAGGQDTFMDVVANLVGILVILMMAIGSRTRVAWEDAAVADAATSNEMPDIRTPQITTANIESDILRIRDEIQNVDLAVRQRRLERDALLARLEFVRQAIALEKDGLSREEQESLQLMQSVAAARDRLKDIHDQRASLEGEEIGPQVLKHDPTPLAQTVLGTEQHLRLLAGRLDYVPLNELVERLREDAERNAWKLKETSEMTETVGPIDGYFLQYTLAVQEDPVMTSQGPAVQRLVGLDQFILVPTAEKLGFPLWEQLQDGSDLSQRLRGIDPSQTTITVWTYPDSYADFRLLRDWLHARGFRAAARPLPAGQPIAGSPRGTRSAAQ